MKVFWRLCYDSIHMQNNEPGDKDDKKKISSPSEIVAKIKTDQSGLKQDLASLRSRQKSKNRLKTAGEILFLAGLTALVVILFLQFGDLTAISATFQEIAKGTNWVWLIGAFLLLILYLAVWPLSMRSFTKALKIDCSFRDVYAIGDAEHFYNGVTPFATGGQPFQVYFLKTAGAETSAATGAVLATFAVHLFVSNVFAISALFFYPYFISGIANGVPGLELISTTTFEWIVAVGYVMNFLTLVLTIATGTSRHLKNGIVKIMRWFANRKFFRKALLKQIPVFEKYCDDTQLAFREVLRHPKATVIACLWRFIADLAYYAIPFFLLLSVGADFSANPFLSFWLVLFGTSFAITSVVWIPTPGSTGGIDYAFAIVVASLAYSEFGGTVFQGSAPFEAAKVVSLLWRMLTFYFVLFVSFGFSMSFQLRTERKQRQELKELNGKATDLSERLATTENVLADKSGSEKQNGK